MYRIKDQFLRRLLDMSKNGYPNTKVIMKYINGERMAQENTLRGFAPLLGVKDWRSLIL